LGLQIISQGWDGEAMGSPAAGQLWQGLGKGGGGESENPMSREKKKKKNPFFKKNFKKKTVFGHPARA
jgi:hypothetical protein